VLAAPVDASAPPVTRLRVPVADNEAGEAIVGGSAAREAAVAIVGADSEHGTSQIYSGPPGGPLAPLGDPVVVRDTASVPYLPIVDGDHLLIAELGPGEEEIRYRIDGGAPFTLPGVILDFAGDLVAYYEDTRGLVLRNWRTGAERTVAVPHPIEW